MARSIALSALSCLTNGNTGREALHFFHLSFSIDSARQALKDISGMLIKVGTLPNVGNVGEIDGQDYQGICIVSYLVDFYFGLQWR